MSELIPDGITRDDVLAGIAAFEANAEHDFADSIAYDLLHEGKRYPPKAILGLAARRLAGHFLKPADFSGGESSKCFRILRGLGFEIVTKAGVEETGYAVITENDDPINDLIPVCPNCHAMLHTKKPAMSIADLRTIMESQKSKGGS